MFRFKYKSWIKKAQKGSLYLKSAQNDFLDTQNGSLKGSMAMALVGIVFMCLKMI